ncbi:PREDICTED: hematopoietic progenitor cell antigen CD34 [Buceros rhinoceros silvestris]|uniref:hematopoietic progenitor cell antigen CD34 n=1 Tax=Buceros rhinoceros silvestris TaxID=175836 RepID=UPI0005280715|nr:PREDICTED: hematopoietic progenitor cell antigen CD34 [Buceros rhinoceros silvestris]
MKWRQLFWISLCMVELSGKAASSSTGTSTPPSTETKGTSSVTVPGATGTPSSTKTMAKTSAAAMSLAPSPTSPGLSIEQTRRESSRAPTQPQSTSSGPDHASQGVTTTERPATQPGMMAETSGSTTTETPGSTAAETPVSTPALTGSPATSGHPSISAATTPLHTTRDSPKPITCHNVKEVSDTGALCLQLNEPHTCKHFLEMKGSDLWSAICEGRDRHVPSPCQIKLAKSEVDHNCMLLILVGERDPSADMLQEPLWGKFGIKALKRGSVRNHQDFSQKTLITLVTCGLLLAFLGLAGYYLMKRRSWSPAGSQAAEDPYYTESGSQGNTMLMMPPQEQPELQEKPNLNGGTQENGTGQVSSKNGHSARQHSPANTEM